MGLEYFDLSGKTALVSGGATGLGLGICQGLAEAGASLAICARRQEVCQEAAQKLAAEHGVRAVGLRMDVGQGDEIGRAVEETCSRLGRIDILVNSAGVGGSEKPILKMSQEEWQNVLDVNLSGAFHLTRAVAGRMVQAGQGGKIIHVASIGGQIVFPNMSAYCSAKAGLVHLTRVMALEWARHNIQVNAILPGYFLTPMNEKLFRTEVGRKLIDRHPMKRIGRIQEIRGLAVMLASPASDFITGSAMVIDGGQSLV